MYNISVILHGGKVTLVERRQLEEGLKTLKLKDSKKTGNILNILNIFLVILIIMFFIVNLAQDTKVEPRGLPRGI